MNVHDYLIDCSSFDWVKLTQTWHWRLPRSFTTWLMNRFGDLFIITDDGRVHVLKLDDGSLRCLADSREEFCEKIDDAKTANDWLMIPLVDRVVAAGKTLGPSECYAFVQIPLIGGNYTVENVAVRKVEYHFSALGIIFEKISELPDKAKVRLKVRNEEQV